MPLLKVFKVGALPPVASREANAVYLVGQAGAPDFRMFVTSDTDGGSLPDAREIFYPAAGGIDIRAALGEASFEEQLAGPIASNRIYEWTPYMLGCRWQTSGLTASQNRVYGFPFRPLSNGTPTDMAVAIYTLGTQTTDAWQRFAIYEGTPVAGQMPRYWNYTRLWQSAPVLHGLGHIQAAITGMPAFDPSKFYMLCWGTTAAGSKVRYSRIMPLLDQAKFFAYGSGTSSHWRSTVYSYKNSQKSILEGTTDFAATLAPNWFVDATSSNNFHYHAPMFRFA